MKVALVIGHHKKSKGAFSKHLKISEYDFYKSVCKDVKNVDVYEHKHTISNYKKRIRNTASKINKKEYDLVIELHFNSFFKDNANGCETLYYYNSKRSEDYAYLFSKKINELLGVKLRHNGLKSLANFNDRGFASVYYTKAPTILIEPFFGSSKSDCKKVQCPENIASVINEFIKEISYEK